MAYTPIEQGRLFSNAGLKAVAKSMTPRQRKSHWRGSSRSGCIARSRARNHSITCARIEAALDITLTEQDIAELDRAFPPPKKKRSLEMI